MIYLTSGQKEVKVIIMNCKYLNKNQSLKNRFICTCSYNQCLNSLNNTPLLNVNKINKCRKRLFKLELKRINKKHESN